MSQTNYTNIDKMKLVEINALPLEVLLEWLSNKQQWFKQSIIRSYQSNKIHHQATS